ncbi:hypothetical protein U6A24_18260 [Aquimarina gracilis]|uniref:Lipoprotein n=1 Tax=Aquimarina gracilis TaxID=874422 RepID=A0ABU5ZZW8_9FLAO|nr:hypothetical protein [Aquimarina gracilis]MEB3347425.1 hypothetical protein [Aquimarina gracilis]
MKYRKLFSLALTYMIIIGCSSDIEEMNEGEKYLAKKFRAEWSSIGLTQTESKTNGKITENRKFLDIIIKNSSDIDKIIYENEYAKKQIKNVAQFVLDSIHFGEMSCKPEEIQVEFIKEDVFLIFKNETKRTMSYNIN